MAALPLTGAVPPSDRITMAAIGVGKRAMFLLPHFLAQKDVQVVAACDCFADRRSRAKELVDRYYGNKDCAAYRFHEQVLERADIDAVLIATGDRWHAVLSILAARAGKDVYCEKPFCLTIAEGRTLVETMKRYGTVWQVGTQGKSYDAYRLVVDVVRSGRIGKLRTIMTSFGGWRSSGLPVPEREPDAEVFDYDRWLGQAPWAPHSELRVRLWRYHWDTSGGSIVDMGPHYLELAQWARGNELTGPVEFEGEGVFHAGNEYSTIPYFFNVRARYRDGVLLYMDSHPMGVRFEGDRGSIQLLEKGDLNPAAIAGQPKSVLDGLEVPKQWKVMTPHIRNFLDCVKSRKLTVSHPEIAHRAHTIAHCANICLRLGRKLRWDPDTERFVGDDDANTMLSRTMRAPWRI